MSTEHHEVIIIGGGMGGLYTAKKLISAGINDVIVFESRGWVGGRITTTRDKDGSTLFNNFAWRIGETNHMMLKLVDELGLKLIPQFTPPPVDKAKGHGVCKYGVLSSLFKKKCELQDEEKKMEDTKHQTPPPNRAPLSDFARSSLHSAGLADRRDRESGYAGRTSQISWPDESHGSQAWVVDGGMDMLPKTLAKSLPEGCVRVNHRAVQVVREKEERYYYTVQVLQRDGNNYTPLKFTCSQIVFATPPYTIRQLDVAKDMLPVLNAVHERRLGHAYVRAKPDVPNIPDQCDVPDRIYRNLPESILQQIISGDYGGQIFQAAYACDRFERVWRELQYHGSDVVKNEIKDQLNKISDMPKPPEGWDDAIEEVFIRIGFVHRWHIEAHVVGKTKQDLSLQAMTPNMARLPGLFLVGEAFSPFQGWTEGALWTADKVSDIIINSRKSEGVYEYHGVLGKYSGKIHLEKDDKTGKLKSDDVSTDKLMVYKGLVMDVNDWHQRHPGGVGPILGHANEDVADLFDSFHNGWPAPLATLFGLQIGCTADV